MIGCLRNRVRKQPIISLYFDFENEPKSYNLEAIARGSQAVCVFEQLNGDYLTRKSFAASGNLIVC